MHSDMTVEAARRLYRGGASPDAVARQLGLPLGTVRHWCRGDRRRPGARRSCPICHGVELDEEQYAYLLGQYLGDGHISVGRRGVSSLSIFCANDWPGVLCEVDTALRAVMPSSSVSQVARSGCREVKSYSTHWPCLFPQHGPGRKHERPIVLVPWQTDIVEKYPGRLLRGLFHSDGCRILNWSRPRAGGKRYEYPRYFFSNKSEDILRICSTTLDLVGVPHRWPRWDMLSVARRDGVARLDEFVGAKY